MKIFKHIVALLVLVTWLPATAHCELEQFSGLEFLQCSGDAPGNSNCSVEGCCAVEQSFYKAPDNATVLLPVAFALVPVLVIPASDYSVFSKVSRNIPAPPELPKCWQFVFRTASPPRAPSFAS